MWIYLIIMVLTYLMSPTDNKSQQRRALLNSLAAGAGAYYVGTQTEWGKDVIASIDGTVSGWFDSSDVPTSDGRVVSPTTGAATANGWDVLKSWGPIGTSALVGTATVATSSTLRKYLPWVLGLGLGVLILKG